MNTIALPISWPRVPMARLPAAWPGWHWVLLLLLSLTQLPSWASSPAVPAQGQAFVLRSSTMAGQAVDLSAMKGRVVLLYYWHTGCAVCLDKMPELRANAAGWQSQAFSLVIVQTDRKMEDAQRYWQSVAQAQVGGKGPVKMPMVLWRGAAGHVDSLTREPAHWPLSVLLDRDGKVAASWEGRIPAEAWDRIAELLP